MSLTDPKENDPISIRQAIQKLNTKLGPISTPTFASMTLTGLTNHSLLICSGSVITSLGVATDGQLPIGSTGADPVLATITGSSSISVANAAGSITLSTIAGGIDHGGLAGLGDSADHTWALLVNGARTLAGAWNMGNQNLTNVDINSGTIDNAVIGGTTPAAGSFTGLTLTGDTSVISSAYAIDLKASGDTTDYLSLSTSGNVPQIGVKRDGVGLDADLLQFAANILTVNGTVTATTVTGANVTSGADPGHTHTSGSVSGFMLDAGTVVDNTLVRFDGVDGFTTQPTGVTINDDDDINTEGDITAVGDVSGATVTGTSTVVTGSGGINVNSGTGSLVAIKAQADDSTSGFRIIDFDTAHIPLFAWQANDVGFFQIRAANVAQIVLQGNADSYILNDNFGLGTATPATKLHVLGTSRFGDQATNYMEIGATGDVVFVQGAGLAYGCIDGIDETITCTTQNVWYQVTFDTAGAVNNIEADTTNNELQVTYEGIYQIGVTACFHTNPSNDFELMVKKQDGTVDLNPHLFQTTAVANKVENTCGYCLIDINASDRVELWVRCTSAAGQNAIFDHVSLSLTQVGGT